MDNLAASEKENHFVPKFSKTNVGNITFSITKKMFFFLTTKDNLAVHDDLGIQKRIRKKTGDLYLARQEEEEKGEGEGGDTKKKKNRWGKSMNPGLILLRTPVSFSLSQLNDPHKQITRAFSFTRTHTPLSQKKRERKKFVGKTAFLKSHFRN